MTIITINKHHRNNSQIESKNSIYKFKDNSSLTSTYIRSDSVLINNNNNIFINNDNAIKISQILRKKLLTFRKIKTGQFNLPLLSEKNKNENNNNN